MKRPKLTFGLPEWADKESFYESFDRKIKGKTGAYGVYVSLNTWGHAFCILNPGGYYHWGKIGQKYLGTIHLTKEGQGES